MGAHLDRRTFLRLGSVSAGLLAASQLRVGSALLAQVEPRQRLRVLSEDEAGLLTAIAERITRTGDPAMPAFSETMGLTVIDVALTQLPADQQRDFHWGLWLFDYGPLFMIGRWSRYRSLAEEQQDEYLRSWEYSSFDVCRLAFDAFKNLSMLGYYSMDDTWKGIHYDGPWIPRPRMIPELRRTGPG